MDLYKDLAAAMALPAENITLTDRCGLDSGGFLSRLYLNGLGLCGVVDITELTKHLTVLDIRDNPDLTEIRISALGTLAAIIRSDSGDYCCEALLADQGQKIVVVEPGHDADESPFAHYFGSGKQSSVVPPSEPASDNAAVPSVSDSPAVAERIKTEKQLLKFAIIGRELTSALQDHIDRTNIGRFSKGLRQLRELARAFEQDKFIRQLIREVKGSISANASEEAVHMTCEAYADRLWQESIGRGSLSDLLIDRGDTLNLNRFNYGRSGLNTIKGSAGKDPDRVKRSVRDDFITGAGYGNSHLRLQIKRYGTLADELRSSLEGLSKKS